MPSRQIAATTGIEDNCRRGAVGDLDAMGSIILMVLALAAIVHGEETRVRVEPDAIVLLVAYCGCLVAVWAAQT